MPVPHAERHAQTQDSESQAGDSRKTTNTHGGIDQHGNRIMVLPDTRPTQRSVLGNRRIQSETTVH